MQESLPRRCRVRILLRPANHPGDHCRSFQPCACTSQRDDMSIQSRGLQFSAQGRSASSSRHNSTTEMPWPCLHNSSMRLRNAAIQPERSSLPTSLHSPSSQPCADAAGALGFVVFAPGVSRAFRKITQGLFEEAHQALDLLGARSLGIACDVGRCPVLESEPEVGSLQQSLEQVIGAGDVVHVQPQTSRWEVLVIFQPPEDVCAGGSYSVHVGPRGGDHESAKTILSVTKLPQLVQQRLLKLLSVRGLSHELCMHRPMRRIKWRERQA